MGRREKNWIIISVVLGVVSVVRPSQDSEEEKSRIREDYRSFLNSQMSHCMKKVIKPTKISVPGPGGFVHCRSSIGNCIDDLLHCKHYLINNEVTENISVATVDIFSFCGHIDIKWNPPVDKTNLYYMARVWNISLQKGYSIDITALKFQLAYSEDCMLDHVRYYRLFSGSGVGMIQDSLWGRICGTRAEFILFSNSSTAQVAVYIESYAILVLDYSVMVSGRVRGLSHAQIEQNPIDLLTGEHLDGYYLKIFTDKSYYWHIKCDVRGRISMSYKVDFQKPIIPFLMTIIDGPLVHSKYVHQTLLQETLFNARTKDLSGEKRSTGKKNSNFYSKTRTHLIQMQTTRVRVSLLKNDLNLMLTLI